jgi:cytochrome c oxidase assembly protein subunit 15
MNGQWIPDVIFTQEPLWRNFFENTATVQFNHRVLATLVFIGILVLWLVAGRHRLPGQVRIGMQLLMAAAVLQVTLGISTLLLHVPVPLAATHQGGALLLFTVALYVIQRMRHTVGNNP